MATFIDPLVRTKKVIVCCGAGGVGKTTTAAAIGVASAAAGRRVLVLTIDPARRLAEAMGIPEAAREPTAVPRARLDALDVPPEGELSAWMLAPEVVFESMVRKLAKDEAHAKEVFANRLYQHLSKIVAGMQEYTAAEALHALSTDGRYDLVVLDTPPSRNALAFLEAPRKLAMFLDERVIGVFLPHKSAFMRAASDLIEKVFTRAFGAGFFDDLQSFLGVFSGMFGGMRAHADAVRSLLLSQDAAFLLVTSPEPAALAEAAFFQSKIRELGLPFAGYVLNRSWAYTRGFVGPETIELPEGAGDTERLALRKLGQLADTERWRAQRDRDLLAKLRMQTESGAAIATPHLGGAVEDLAGLGALAKNLVQLDNR
ncbi:Arsenical pump-driving ATPase [Labilithrix luteola]|uniref:arsenite-transporting ATPase n=1 Tax=Labilithrix luteola TaxID=1391654 RepID=A0A0K1QDK2_9BACT|nr:ArsA-related P-loop ATPase [Labilithrix luteola]AKV03515.1 Arsenical pump-driving ATPase [Labilithrix luteola]